MVLAADVQRHSCVAQCVRESLADIIRKRAPSLLGLSLSQIVRVGVTTAAAATSERTQHGNPDNCSTSRRVHGCSLADAVQGGDRGSSLVTGVDVEDITDGGWRRVIESGEVGCPAYTKRGMMNRLRSCRRKRRSSG